MLEKNYLKSLNDLKDILIQLNSTKILDNKNLNKIGIQTYRVLKNLYSNCKIYYTACIIAYIQYNINNKINLLKKRKNLFNNLS